MDVIELTAERLKKLSNEPRVKFLGIAEELSMLGYALMELRAQLIALQNGEDRDALKK